MSHKIVTFGESVLARLSPPGDYLSRSLGLRAMFMVWPTPRGLQRFSQGTEDSRYNICTLPLLCLWVSPRNELILLSSASSCVTAIQGIPLDHLPLVVSRACVYVPIELYIFSFFKNFCLRIWIPVSLDLGADVSSPF